RLGGNAVQLFEQRHVDVGLDVAHRARIAVPVPRAAEVAAALDDAYVLDAGFAQASAREQTAEAAADDDDLDLVEERRALEALLDVGILDVVGELPVHLDVLVVAVRTEPFLALLLVLLAQRLRVEAEFLLSGVRR